MPANTVPIFTLTPKVAVKLISAANALRNGTGTIVDVWSAGSNGSRIEHVEIRAVAATTAGVVRLFIYDGTTYFLIREYLVTAITPSVSIKVFETSENFSLLSNVLLLPSGYKLSASTNNAESFNVIVTGGDY